MFVSRSTLVGILRRFNKFVPSLLAETLYINNKTQPTAMAVMSPLHHYLAPISRPGKIHNGTYLRSWIFSEDLLNFTPVSSRKPYFKDLLSSDNHILWLKVCEVTVLTVLKSFFSNVYERREGCRRAENGDILIFTSSGWRQPSPRWKVLLKNNFKTVNTVISQTINHKICFKYAIRRRSQLSVVSF